MYTASKILQSVKTIQCTTKSELCEVLFRRIQHLIFLINKLNTFAIIFSDHFSFISARLKVSNSLSAVALYCRFVISPIFETQKKAKKEIQVGKAPFKNFKIKIRIKNCLQNQCSVHNLAASTSLSNSPRYMYLHHTIMFSVGKRLVLPILILTFEKVPWFNLTYK